MRVVSGSKAKAVIDNGKSNKGKTKWIEGSWFSLIIGLGLLLVFMVVFTVDNAIEKKSHSIITPTQQTLQKIYSVDNNTISEFFPLPDSHRYTTFKSVQPTLFPVVSKPWIGIDHEWQDNNITVYLTVHSALKDEKRNLELLAKQAIAEWSNDLKSASHNSSAWNFNVMTLDASNMTGNASRNIRPADISVILLDEPNFALCSDAYGHTDNVNDSRYAIIYTSCGELKSSKDEIYTTVLHEFGHAIGLGHAYNKDGDLMCSVDINEMKTCSMLPTGLTKPSTLDLNALLYVYGNDGLGGFNRVVTYKPYYFPQ